MNLGSFSAVVVPGLFLFVLTGSGGVDGGFGPRGTGGGARGKQLFEPHHRERMWPSGTGRR